ncbi:potassium channel family protein [Halobacillus amylolyticus]|uniref:Potassium channel family protein n=1 Tax=Halobacillus amylolyticus TaxID=2932259 RepID=A0ABY4HAD0_9BACI|nr:potassium channel family protein [Halobacillus amylolyticus]UOR11846.1 potassium channel family protein [Halobacillus amylolyticus]
MQQWIRFYFQLPVLIRLLSIALVTMLFFGMAIHLIEPKNFPTFFDGIWWAFVTGATVGYGDYVPISLGGRIVAILLIFTGGGLITFYMVTLSSATVKHEQALSKGKVRFKGESHIVLLGWNERTRQLIDMMRKDNIEDKIVLIDETMNQLYQELSNVHFVKGDPTSEDTLEKANVCEARMAVVTANPSKKEQQSDQAVIHQLVALKGHHPNLFIIAEVLTERQKINAERAGANTVIRSNDFMSSLFYHELYRKDPLQPFQLFLNLLTARQFHEEKVSASLAGVAMINVLEHYLAQGSQVIGVKTGDTISFNIDTYTTLTEEDYLVLFTPFSE